MNEPPAVKKNVIKSKFIELFSVNKPLDTEPGMQKGRARDKILV